MCFLYHDWIFKIVCFMSIKFNIFANDNIANKRLIFYQQNLKTHTCVEHDLPRRTSINEQRYHVPAKCLIFMSASQNYRYYGH